MIQQLQLDNKTTFIQSIQKCINVIPSLSPYWHMHHTQLSAMIRQLRSPHLFFTLSAADLHWPELHHIIEQQRAVRNSDDPLDINTLDPTTAYDHRIANLTKFPYIVASFLQARVKLFLDTIGKCHNMKHIDFWYRFEWQHQGSGYVHEFIWLENGPNIDDKDLVPIIGMSSWNISSSWCLLSLQSLDCLLPSFIHAKFLNHPRTKTIKQMSQRSSIDANVIPNVMNHTVYIGIRH